MPIFDGLAGFFDPRRKPVELPDISTPGTVPYNPNTTPPSMMGPTPGRQTRKQELDEARNVYLQGTPGRKKSGLIGALLGGLQGLQSGGLAGGLGGAIAGGLGGAINPRGLREAEFNRKVLPQMLEGFAYDDQDRAMQMQQQKAREESAFNAARLGQIGADTAESQARARKLGEPTPDGYSSASGIGIFNTRTGQVSTPAPKDETQPRWVKAFGRNRKTGRLGYFNAADPANEELYDVMPEPRSFAPRAAAKPKEDIPTIPISKVREIAAQQGVSVDTVKARLVAKRIKVVE